MADRYQSLQNEPEDRAPDSWKRFHVVLTGRTNGAHEPIVKLFRSLGQTEVRSPEDADYWLLVCPVVSRAGTDVRDALDRLQPGKEAVLVVMHQTFNPQQVIPPSSRLVEDQRVPLTVDCMFHQNKLLRCKFNNKMETTIKMFFNVSHSKALLQLVLWLFLGLLSFLVSMLDWIAAVFLFILGNHNPSVFRRLSVFITIAMVVLVIWWLYDNNAERIREDHPSGQNRERQHGRHLKNESGEQSF